MQIVLNAKINILSICFMYSILYFEILKNGANMYLFLLENIEQM